MDNLSGKTELKINRTAKDSVFRDLFDNPRNLLEMYKKFHPEDTDVTEECITNITLESMLTNRQYNDCGFMVKDKIIIMVEAQSTWSENILIRALFYLTQSYQEYFEQKNANLYSSTKAEVPKPEIYVIYTGERGNKPERLSLSEQFFNGEEIDLEVKATVIYESDSDDIVNQYIIFCKVFNEQIKKHGRKTIAVTETIRICKDRNILREYLEKRETEVVTMFDFLFNQEEVTRLYVHEEAQKSFQMGVNEGIQTGVHNTAFESAKRFLKAGKITPDEILHFYPELQPNDIEKLKSELHM